MKLTTTSYQINGAPIKRTVIFCPECNKKHIFVKGTNLQIFSVPPVTCRECGILIPDADALQININERMYFHKEYIAWPAG
jgi:hypothetical protein